jgi:hypothetical protein
LRDAQREVALLHGRAAIHAEGTAFHRAKRTAEMAGVEGHAQAVERAAGRGGAEFVARAPVARAGGWREGRGVGRAVTQLIKRRPVGGMLEHKERPGVELKKSPPGVVRGEAALDLLNGFIGGQRGLPGVEAMPVHGGRF